MFVTLVIRRAVRMRRIILPSVNCPALQYFPTFHKLQFLDRFPKRIQVSVFMNPCTERRAVQCGRIDGWREADRQDEANSRLSQFCERAYI